jgi:Flp pilus assembly protein TadD
MVLRAFEDHYVLRAGQRAGRPWTQLQSQRMSGPLRLAGHRITGLAAAARPATFADRLADAVRAFARGDYDLADRHAWRALRVSAEAGRGAEARAQTLLGNIAYQRGHPQRARDHYVTAAKLFEATTSRRAVGHLLAAIGRLHLTEDDTAAAAVSLQSAVSRLPFDGSVKVDLARAFAASGAQRAAVAVLEGVLADNEPEAGRALSLRSAILADLGEAR